MNHWWRWGLRSLGLGLLVWILWRADWRQLALLADRVDLSQLYPVPLLALAMIGVRAWRWNLLLRLQNLQLPPWRAGVIYTAGIFLGMITPGRLGDLGKAMYLYREQGTPLEKIVASTLADRLFDLSLMLMLAGWAVSHLELWPSPDFRWLMALGVGGGGLVLLYKQSGKRRIERIQRHRAYQFARGLKTELQGLVGWVGLWAFVLTVLAYGLYFAQTLLLAQAIGLALSAADVTAAIVLVGLASFLPISIAGLGTREGILILVMAQKAIPNSIETALAYSGIFFAFCFVLPAVIGYICWLKIPMSSVIMKNLSSGNPRQ